MKSYPKVFIGTCAAIFLSLMIFTNICEAKKKFIAIGSSSSASSHYSYTVGAAKGINQYVPEVKANVVETGASVDNIKRLTAGQLDMGIGGMTAMFKAWKGLGPWKDKPVSDLRFLWMYAKSADFIVVREDSGVKTLQDLEGKSFNAGIRGSATEDTTKQMLNALGIKPNYYVGGTADAVKAFKDNRIVGYIKSGVGTQLDASTLDIMTFTKVRLLSLSKDQAGKIMKTIPYISIITIPTGTIKAMPNAPEIRTIGHTIGMMCRATMPKELAYKIVKAALKGRKYQISAYPATKNTDMVQDSPALTKIPLHAGALKAYRELGAKNIPDSVIPPEAK
jgi:hypothetical protein